jgi:hypothetical protein
VGVVPKLKFFASGDVAGDVGEGGDSIEVDGRLDGD